MKKYLALLLALCMVFALAACGESAAPAAQRKLLLPAKATSSVLRCPPRICSAGTRTART